MDPISLFVSNKALLRRPDGKILAVRLFEKRNGRPETTRQWDFPGGRISGGESTFESLRREVLEETGVYIDVKEAQMIFAHTFNYGRGPGVVQFFLVDIEDQHIELSDEHDKMVWLDMENLDAEFVASAQRIKVQEVIDAYKALDI